MEKDVAFSKGTYRGWYFILGPRAPPVASISSRSSQSRWCRSRRTAVSSASKRGSRPGLMDFTTPWGPLNPHSPSPLTSRSFQPPRAFPHTFSRFHVSAHVRRDKYGASLFSPPRRQIFIAPTIMRSGPSAKMYRLPSTREAKKRP